MQRIATIIIGAGHCGLAMSHCLTKRSMDHVILERGQVANSWRTERWDSLRLLTPNWQSRLPGNDYRGPEPDGYMPVSDLVDRLDRYASSISAPLMTGTEVRSVTRDSDGEVVEGDPKKVREVTDIWTFAREVASRNPNWKLVATEAAN